MMNDSVETRSISPKYASESSYGQSRPQRFLRPSGPPKTVALVDWSFWNWLHPQLAQDPGEPSTEETSEEKKLFSHLSACCAEVEFALRQAPVISRLSRVMCYWARDRKAPAVNGVSIRLVNTEEFDGGLSRLRMMAADLRSIASQGLIDRVLLISDDDRLTLLVDELQRNGLSVDVWTDVSDINSPAGSDDSSWARLQSLADQKVIATKGIDPAQFIPSDSGQVVCDAQDQVRIEAEVEKWWLSLDPEEQARWIKEIRDSRSVPPHLDREMLLRVRQHFGGIMSLPQKLAMRVAIRETVIGTTESDQIEEVI